MGQDGVADTVRSRSAWCSRLSPIIHTPAAFALPCKRCSSKDCGNWDKVFTHPVSCCFFLLTVLRLLISLLPTLCRTNCNILPWWNQQKGSRRLRSLNVWKVLKSFWDTWCQQLVASKLQNSLLEYSLICYAQNLFMGKMNTSYRQSQEFIAIPISLNSLVKVLSVQLWWY